MESKLINEKVPHSWAIEDWPAGVYPGRVSRGRYIIRSHRDELVAAGALTRIGRELVVMGAAYEQWMQRQSGRVAGFDLAVNDQKRPALDWKSLMNGESSIGDHAASATTVAGNTET